MNKKKSCVLFMVGLALYALYIVGGMLPIVNQLNIANAEEALAPSKTTGAEDEISVAVGSPKGSSTMKAYIDPETGEFITSPGEEPAMDKKRAAEAAYSTSHDGLVETPSKTPGGGIMIDLQGRFRNPLTAKQERNGNLIIQHQPGESANDKKE